MGITYKKTKAVFDGLVGADEAEKLLDWLQSTPRGKVDLTKCTHLHPANLQVLLAARVKGVILPGDPELKRWLEDLFPTDD